MLEKFGNISDTVSLLINVQDYDTLNPYFSQSVYNGKISENQVKAFHWMLQMEIGYCCPQCFSLKDSS